MVFVCFEKCFVLLLLDSFVDVGLEPVGGEEVEVVVVVRRFLPQ